MPLRIFLQPTPPRLHHRRLDLWVDDRMLLSFGDQLGESTVHIPGRRDVIAFHDIAWLNPTILAVHGPSYVSLPTNFHDYPPAITRSLLRRKYRAKPATRSGESSSKPRALLQFPHNNPRTSPVS